MCSLQKNIQPQGKYRKRKQPACHYLLCARIRKKGIPAKIMELDMVVRKSNPPMKEIFKDKNGFYSMREMVTALFVVITVISWISTQFFGIAVPEYMFYSFISIIGAGCFGYSIEKKVTNKNKQQE